MQVSAKSLQGNLGYISIASVVILVEKNKNKFKNMKKIKIKRENAFKNGKQEAHYFTGQHAHINTNAQSGRSRMLHNLK